MQVDPTRERALARWGRWSHRHAKGLLVLSALFLVLSLVGLASAPAFNNDTTPQDTEAARASRLLSAQIPHPAGPTFLLIFGSSAWNASDPRFAEGLSMAMGALENDSDVASVLTPWNAPASSRAALVGTDEHHVLVVVEVKPTAGSADAFPPAEYGRLRGLVSSPTLTVAATGPLAIDDDFNAILAADLARSEIVSIPLSLTLLVLVFASVVGALLPVAVGGIAVAGGVAALYALARVTDVSPYALNITTLIGLGVAIDYSLFLLSRFREELRQGATSEDALASTMGTAGRSVLFSGLTVAIGLSGLLFYQHSFLASMGLAGAVVVAIAILYSFTLLPALLALLGPRVNALPVPFLRSDRTRSARAWHRLAEGVLMRPVAVLLPVLFILLAAASPFAEAQIGGGDISVLPADAPSRIGFDLLQAQFPAQAQNTVDVVLQFHQGSALDPAHVRGAFTFTTAVERLPDVGGVQSIVSIEPNWTAEQYAAFYSQPSASLPVAVRTLLNETVGPAVILITVHTSASLNSPAALRLLASVRALAAPPGATIAVTGDIAESHDTTAYILGLAPAVGLYIMAATYLLLLLTFRSVILPLKAVTMNLLSIGASFGALVFVFQDGNFSTVLHFAPGPIVPQVPIILFCIVFGLSMDYEVLILSRMREAWLATGNNQEAVVSGLEKTGGLVTGAAAIMVVVFGSFALARVVVIQSIGFGLALAIALDATLVRALVVPATMRLLGRLNWWAPRWLRER